MPSPELDRLVRIGQLHHEQPLKAEFDGLVRSAEVRLDDAHNEELAPESRFDLAYGAAHSLALAALRWHGYRAGSRYLVFQALPLTLGTDTATWRLLAKCHERRNLGAYEGVVEIEERLLTDLVAATTSLLMAVQALPPIE